MITLLSGIHVANTNTTGRQTGPELAAFANGGFAIGWTDRQTNVAGATNVLFARFDGAGVKQGTDTLAAQQAAGGEVLTDLIALGNGSIAIGWVSSGSNLAAYGVATATSIPVARVFNQAGAAVSADTTAFSTSAVYTTAGFELVATSVSGFQGIFGTQEGANTVIRAQAFSNTGVAGAATTPGTLTGVSHTVIEAANGPGSPLVLTGPTTTGTQIFTTAAVNAPIAAANTLDIEQINTGAYALGVQTAINNSSSTSLTTTLNALTGNSNSLAAYFSNSTTLDNSSTFATTPGTSAARDVTMLNLKDGQVLAAWVQDFGGTTSIGNLGRGIYVAAVDLATGTVGPEVQIDSTFVDANTTVELTQLADGRVAVSWSRPSFTNGDVFYQIIDPRIAGVTVNGTSGSDIYVGSSFSDVLSGGTGGNDRLFGGGGDDRIIAGTGNDVFDGGAGFDTISYATASAAVGVHLVSSSQNLGEALGDTLTSIEGVEGSAFNDTLVGNADANTLNGGVGADLLYGRAGDDDLVGGAGNDLLSGAEGNDQVDGGADNDRLYGADGNDVLIGGLGDDVAVGGIGADVISGDAGADRLYGQAGADVIDGGDGDDVVIGDTDNDDLSGGAGLDFIDGGDGNDAISGGLDNDRLFGGGGSDSILGEEGNDLARGGDGNDTLVGDVGDDRLFGDAGADQLEGGDGNDSLNGGAGADVLNGGAGVDTARYDDAPVIPGTPGIGVVADLSGETAGAGDATGDTFSSIEGLIGSAFDDVLIGNEFGNTLSGLAGDDVIDGGAGGDALVGGAGADTLTGGTSNDTFRFNFVSEGGDVIMDFTTGDRIQLKGTSFGGITTATLPSSFSSVADAQTATAGAGARLFFDNSGVRAGELYFDANGADTAGRELIATFLADGENPFTTLTASSIFII